jgi:ankyrin repeat protein
MVELLLDKGAKLEDEILFKEEGLSGVGVHFQIIKNLLKRGANPKATDVFGNTLLHKQCHNGNMKNANYLINHYNADVNAKNDEGRTPLHLACTNWDGLKMVKFLIEEKRADPTVTCNRQETALHYAAYSNSQCIVKYLIEEQRLDIEATDNEGRTALHAACQNFFPRLFTRWSTQKYLIEEHAKIIEAKDKNGKTALHYCIEIVEYPGEKYLREFRPFALILAKKAKILQTPEKETDCIFDWIKQSYDIKDNQEEGNNAVSCIIKGLKWFQNQLYKSVVSILDYNPLLYIALFCNRVDIAEYMFNQDLCYIEKHFKAEKANSKRNLLAKIYLIFSCENGFKGLIIFLFQEIKNRQDSFQDFSFDRSFIETAYANNHYDVFKYLLEDEKAKNEAAEFLKNFPLHYVCRLGSLEVVKYLVETKQINIEEKDKEGIAPLHWACTRASIKIAEYLIEKQNANTNTTDTKGRSVWHFACQSRSRELVQYISHKTKIDVNIQDDDGSTALHLACTKHNLDVVKFLINDMKANLHLIDNEGRTPLHIHCQNKFSQVPIIKYLVDNGANVCAKDKSGKTPLQIAEAKKKNDKERIAFLKAATKR